MRDSYSDETRRWQALSLPPAEVLVALFERDP
jgi:hypothetical protein